MRTQRSGLKFAIVTLGILALSLSVSAAQSPGGELPAAPIRIAGTVVSTSGGGVLAWTRVILRDTRNPKNLQSLLSGEDGRFEFHVTGGKYALQGTKRGFITAGYEQHEQFSTAIVTGAGLDTENLRLKLAPMAVLSGRVLDESGDPVRNAQVTLWRDDHSSGVSRIVRVRNDMTDDQGTYEFTPLGVGTYFLSATGTPWYAVHPLTAVPEGSSITPAVVDRALDVVYPTTFYFGATESADATPILLRGGDRLELDLRLAPVPALHVVFRGELKGDNFSGMPLLSKRIFDGIELDRHRENISVISPGVFEMAIAPGKYSVNLAGQPEHNSRINEVEIFQDHQQVDTSSGEASSSIKALVKIPGEDNFPRELFVGLRERKRGGYFQEVNRQEEAELPNVAPGSYEVLAGSQDKSYAVVKIAAEGQETAGHTLKVPAGASMSLTLTLVSGSGRVEGYAKQAGKAAAGAMVVLIPKHPEANLELFRRDQSDLDGSFVLQGVIPGTYTVVAIADGWDLDWSRAGVLAKYAGHGQTVVVPGSGSHAVQLPEAVEVQGK